MMLEPDIDIKKKTQKLTLFMKISLEWIRSIYINVKYTSIKILNDNIVGDLGFGDDILNIASKVLIHEKKIELY